MSFNPFPSRFSSKHSLFFIIATVIGTVTPFFMLMVPGGGSLCFFLLLGIAILFFISKRKWPNIFQEYSWFFIGLIAWSLLIVFQMILLGLWSGRNFEPVLRFLSGLLLLPFLSYLPSSLLRRISWGIVLSAISVCLYAIFRVFFSSFPRADTSFTCAITFGNISLLLGFWSLLSFYWEANPSKFFHYNKILKLSGFFAGVYASLLSGSRGGWLAIPLFIGIMILFFKKYKPLSKHYIIAFVAGWVVIGIAPERGILSSRTSSALTALKQYVTIHYSSLNRIKDLSPSQKQTNDSLTNITPQTKDLSSPQNEFLRKENCEKNLYQYASVHQRLELWRAALHTFKKYPILGVGKGKFQQETTQLAEKGIVIPTITEYKHAHNEVLFMMSEFGIFGLIVLLVFYYGSFIHFYRSRHHLDITIRTAAYMGLILSVGIIVFGLTEVIFIKVKEIGFFVVMMSLFLGIIASRKRELSSQAKYYMY